MDEPVLLAGAGDVHADLRVVPPDRLQQVELRLDVDAQRRARLVERRLHVRLRGKMEYPLRLDRRDELLDRTGIGELAVQERDTSAPPVIAERPTGGVPALDHLHLVLSGESLEILGTRTPSIRRVDRDVGVIGEDVFSEVTAGEAGDTRDQDPHRTEA